MSGSDSQDVTDNDNDRVSDTLLPEGTEPQLSSRPQRLAAAKARTRVSEWSKILRGPGGCHELTVTSCNCIHALGFAHACILYAMFLVRFE